MSDRVVVTISRHTGQGKRLTFELYFLPKRLFCGFAFSAKIPLTLAVVVTCFESTRKEKRGRGACSSWVVLPVCWPRGCQSCKTSSKTENGCISIIKTHHIKSNRVVDHEFSLSKCNNRDETRYKALFRHSKAPCLTPKPHWG